MDDLILVLRPVEQFRTWDILAYVLFGLALLGLIISGDEGVQVTGAFAIILMGAMIDKTYAIGWILEPDTATLQMRINTHIGTYMVMLMRAAMFGVTMLGIMTTRKKWPRILFVILMVLTLGYTMGRWLDQDGAAFFQSRGIGYILTSWLNL